MPKQLDGSGAADMQGALAALADLTLEDLKARWEQLYGTQAPRRLGRALLTKGIAYRLQERALGGLKPVTRRRLERIAVAEAAGSSSSVALAQPARLKPGTRLLREWHGVTHEVIVLDSGVRYRGETYTSLSAVAREITGARWSGPLFFGLKGERDG